MLFALRHAALYGLRRVIVVVPYTSIIEQNAKVYREVFGDDSVLEHHSNLDPDKEISRKGEELTTKHRLASENWEASIIVTTTVQFFESLFANRSSRCHKLHNIASSVVILDEVQSLPPEFLITILDALKQLTTHYGCTIALSTATPPALVARPNFAHGLPRVTEIIPDPAKGEPPAPADIVGTLEKGEMSHLNFRRPAAFHKEFGIFTIQHGYKSQTDMLYAAFEELKNSP
jgi:CRISPR-associated endonuclease/helicase Cas3